MLFDTGVVKFGYRRIWGLGMVLNVNQLSKTLLTIGLNTNTFVYSIEPAKYSSSALLDGR